jgi:hypothetical protein
MTTLEEVIRSPQFSGLTKGQQSFIREITSNGWDRVEAAKVAWDCKTDKSAREMARRAMQHDVVRTLLGLIDPTRIPVSRAEAIGLISKHARSAEKAADLVRCIELMQTLGAFGQEEEAEPEEKPSEYAAALKRREKEYLNGSDSKRPEPESAL